jgi:hypothetical protein
MWNYPKSAKHQAFIEQLDANHDRELAKVGAVEAAQKRDEQGRQALVEIKTKLTATRAQTERLRAERLARPVTKHAGQKSQQKKVGSNDPQHLGNRLELIPEVRF